MIRHEHDSLASCGRRGLAIQLRDKGAISGIQFTNVTLETEFRDADESGGAEPIHVTALPRSTLTKVRSPVGVLGAPAPPWHTCCTLHGRQGARFVWEQVGTIRNVAFVNVSCQAEAGAIIAGSEQSTIDGLSLNNVRMELRRLTALPGGTRDLRPGLRGIVRDVPSAAVFVEWANHVHLADVEVCLPRSRVLASSGSHAAFHHKPFVKVCCCLHLSAATVGVLKRCSLPA